MDSFARINAAAHDGDFGLNSRVHPSLEQIRAGNYKKGRTRIYGLPVAIETPQGQRRTGKANGEPWSVICQAHYGYLIGTKAADGDPIDVYIGPWPESNMVHVINQNDAKGRFDEVKVMMAFPDAMSAKNAYMNSYERGWTGFGSMVSCTVEQFKWWLKNGNTKIALVSSALPFDSTNEKETMNVVWDSASALPVNTTVADIVYRLRCDDKAGELLDAISEDFILSCSDGEMMLDALVVPFSKVQRKMEQMQKVMEAAGDSVTVVGMQVTPPFKQRGTTNVAAIFELSDGQTVSIFMHNPDTNPNKLAPSDELISWKWLLNKKDITILVAPERGEDVNVREVARRIMRVATANSAKFQAANGKRAERMANIESLKEQVTEKEALSAELDVTIADLTAKVEAKRAAPKPATAISALESEQQALIAGASIDSLADGINTRFTAIAERPNKGWLVMNAPRPLLGTETYEGGFLSGKFYAAIDPNDSMAARYVEENRKLAAVVVLVATIDEQMMMALNMYPKYKANYLSMVAEGDNAATGAIKSLLPKIQDKPYAEAKTMLEQARAELDGKSVYELAKQGNGNQPAVTMPDGVSDNVKRLAETVNQLYREASDKGLSPVSAEQYMAEINSGNRSGFSISRLKDSLDAFKQQLVGLNAGTVSPRSVVGTGGTKKAAMDWTLQRISETEAAISGGGMGEFTNLNNYHAYLRQLIATGKDQYYQSDEQIAAEKAARDESAAKAEAEAKAIDEKAAASRNYAVGSESGMKSPLSVVFSINTSDGSKTLAELADLATPEEKFAYLDAKAKNGIGGVKRTDKMQFNRQVDFNMARRKGVPFGYFKITPRAGYSVATLTIDLSGAPASVSTGPTQSEANGAIRTLSPFLSAAQRGAMKVGMLGEESGFFREKAVEMAKVIANMPSTYEQDGKGDDAVAYLHYFTGSADWYITEKDKTGEGTEQAFGYADLGYGGELGYISIAEIVSAGAELDLHWSPKTIREIKGGGTVQPEADRMAGAIDMVNQVVGETGGTLSAWEESGNWKYANLSVNGATIRIGVSSGGVVQIDGRPFDGSNNVNDNMASIRASILAAVPPAPAPAASVGTLPWDGAPSDQEDRWAGTSLRLTAKDRRDAESGLKREGAATLVYVFNGGKVISVKWDGATENMRSIRLNADDYNIEVLNLVDNRPESGTPSPTPTPAPAATTAPPEAAQENAPKTISEAIAAGATTVEESKASINMALPKKERDDLLKSMPKAYLVGNGIRFPLKTDADVTKANNIIADEEDKAAFKPFDPATVRMPGPKQLGIDHTQGFIGLVGSDGWSNGHIIDVVGKPSVAEKAFNTLFQGNLDNVPRKVKMDEIEPRIIAPAKSSATTLLIPTASYRLAKVPAVVLTNAQAQVGVVVNAYYYAYFAKAYKGAEFYGSDENGPVVVKKGGKFIGLIMPMRGAKKDRVLSLGVNPPLPAAPEVTPTPTPEVAPAPAGDNGQNQPEGNGGTTSTAPTPAEVPQQADTQPAEDTALTEAKTYLQSVVDGAVDYMNPELETKLTVLYEQFNGKDTAFDDLFNRAAEAYSNAMIAAAKAAMA